MNPEDVFHKPTPPILDLFSLIKFMQERGYGDLYDDLMDAGGTMWPDWHYGRNDSYWHGYRSWMNTERGRDIWDLICMELGLDPENQIVFWVSW